MGFEKRNVDFKLWDCIFVFCNDTDVEQLV